MKTKGMIISTGFALFSMFFGSGNLAFPVSVGLESGGHSFLATVGILLTGVLVPLMGALGMMLYKGDLNAFFSCLGKKGAFLFSLIALALMGPFGVVPRCLTVAHGALLLLFPNLSLPLTSLALCLIVYLLTQTSRLVNFLGSFLTPLLLASIAAVAFFGLYQAVPPDPIGASNWQAFSHGFLEGYQTMDLVAAFFFSQFTIQQLYRHFASEDHSSAPKLFLKSSFIAAIILSAVYCALVLIGWAYSPLLMGAPPEKMLGLIALTSLGPVLSAIVCLMIILACLSTAVVLVLLFAEFLNKEITKEKLGANNALLLTLVVSFGISTFAFSGIAAFLGPILAVLYPALITLTVMNIAHKLFGFRTSHWPFTVTLLARLCMI